MVTTRRWSDAQKPKIRLKRPQTSAMQVPRRGATSPKTKIPRVTSPSQRGSLTSTQQEDRSPDERSQAEGAPRRVRFRANALQPPQLGNHFVQIFIGPDHECVTLHSEPLPESTKLYILEQSRGVLPYQLIGEDPAIVNIYRLFLYRDLIFSKSAADQDIADDGEIEAHNDAEWMRFAQCYFFGVTVEDERFANASIDAMIDKMEDVDRYPTGIASKVYTYTQPGDKLRQMIVDVHVRRGSGTWTKAPHDDANGPKDFFQDVVQGMQAAGADLYDEDVPMPWESKCAYHSHALTPRCGD